MTAEEVIRKMIAEHRGTMLSVEYTYLNGLKAALAAVQLATPEELRNTVLEELAQWYTEKGFYMDEDDIAPAIRALKSGDMNKERK